MANEEHLKILEQGVEAWNEWREENPNIRPNLSESHLVKMDLLGANFTGANLTKASLIWANLSIANLTWANLIEANLGLANLMGADLLGANIMGASLIWTNLVKATLNEAHLDAANLIGANFTRADLDKTSFRWAAIAGTTFADVDLSTAEELETVQHLGPSFIDIHTLYRSGGKIPEAFLRGCGVQPELITYLEKIKIPECPYTKEQLDDWIDNLQKRLTVLNRRLAHYQLQAAKYGTLDVPFSIVQEIDSTKEEIKKAEGEREEWQKLRDVHY